MGITIALVVAALAVLVFIVAFTKLRPVTTRRSGVWSAGSGGYAPFAGGGYGVSDGYGCGDGGSGGGGCGGGGCGGGGCGGG